MKTNKLLTGVSGLEDIAGTLPAMVGETRSRLIATDDWQDVVRILREIGEGADFKAKFEINRCPDGVSVMFVIDLFAPGSCSIYSEASVWFTARVDEQRWSVVSKEETLRKLRNYKARNAGENQMKRAIEACGFRFED